MSASFLKKNDEIKLHITAMTSEGSGIGRYCPEGAENDGEGFAVFVRGTVPGDDIVAHIIKVSKNYAVGIIGEILTPSPERIEPECPHAKQCGGCSFWQMTYDEEIKYKLQRVNDAVLRVGKVRFECEGILPADNIQHYRNKAEYPVKIENGKFEAGFYAYKSHRVVSAKNCLLQPKEFETGLNVIEKWVSAFGVTAYDEKTGRGLLRHVYFRKATGTGEMQVTLVVNGNTVPQKEKLVSDLKTALPFLKSVAMNVNVGRTNVILGNKTKIIWGNEKICDTLTPKVNNTKSIKNTDGEAFKFLISPESFYQVNHDGCEKLYGLLHEFAALNGSETVLDLYCGAGTIGLTLAPFCKNVVGVEVVPSAVENAKENATLNGIENAQFILADAFKGAEIIKGQGINIDIVVLDPPRKGCQKELLELIKELNIPKIIYVSCDSATFARDLNVLTALGYTLKHLKAVDMFPRTPHVETVALMLRK